MEEPVFGVKLKKTGTRVPVVLSEKETGRIFQKLEEPAKVPKKTDGRYGLAARLQYGAGLRLSELVRLRVQDVDVERGTVTVRQGKGAKDRMTVLPKSLRDEVAEQIERARAAYAWTRPAYAWTRQQLRKMLRWNCASEGGSACPRDFGPKRKPRGALGGLTGEVWTARDLRVGVDEG